ncbi:hypothetical protein L6452_09159 [Arctium lappa]|uniref:Uncharacterized protein n=1 Tax=Arctium lappa TaxID=4217 RepID=A0ACB9DJQ1_ARCLA|nr:hypothetical protein L6452_09159 [Arctium lappa]
MRVKIVRGSGMGGVVDDQATASWVRPTEPDTSSTLHDVPVSHDPTIAGTESNASQGHNSSGSSSSSTESDNDRNQFRFASIGRCPYPISSTQPSPKLNSPPHSSPQSQPASPTPISPTPTSPQPTSPTSSNHPTPTPSLSQANSGDIRRAERVSVENEYENESVCVKERCSKRNRELSSITAKSRRVATSTINSHVLGRGIEKDVVDPAAQAQTPPDHSIISQQMVVSDIHGDIAHMLPGSHLESQGIEQDRPQPQPLTSFEHILSLDPIHSRTHTKSIVASLCSPTGTAIVTPTSGAPRGLTRSPTTTIITPVVNVGGTTSTVVTPTRSLCDPGVSLPSSLTLELLQQALHVVDGSISRHFDQQHRSAEEFQQTVLRMLKGKSLIVEARL